MTTAHRVMTADELFMLRDGDKRHELVRGELRTMAPAGFEHGAIGIRIASMLSQWVREHDLGTVVGADTGFVLSRNPDTVRVPDVAFVSKARLAAGVPKKFFPGAPDLAVEVLSPSDTVEEIEEKVMELLDEGTRLVWVVNPRLKSVTVYRPGPRANVIRGDERLGGEDVVGGFEVGVGELFAG